MQEIPILIGVFALWAMTMWSAVRRVKKQLDLAIKPTIWVYVNELGGNIVVGLLLLVWIISYLARILF
jgi:hypothetical protein